jgi:VWFA-related protein
MRTCFSGRPGAAIALFIFFETGQLVARQVQPPAERAAELLTITFAAADASGKFTNDLRAADVSVRIDGRPRAIRSLQVVAVAGVPRADTAIAAPPFGTNAVTTRGRKILLAIDDESFPPGGEQALRAAAERLFASLSPDDRIAVVTIHHGGAAVAPTTDRVRVRGALSLVVGRGDTAPSGSALACRTRLTLEALSRQLRGARSAEAPNVVVLLTSGLAAPRRDAPVTMAPGMCELPLQAFREAGDAAGAARAQFYVVPPVEIMSMGTVQRENIAGAGALGSDNPMEGIEQLLGVTGGKLLNLGAGERTAFDRIASESASYYVATLDPQRSDRDRAHALEVKVARPGVEVRASRSVTFAEPDPRTRPPSPSPRDMLSTLAEFRDLPLRAAAYPSFEDEASGRVVVLAVAEAVDPGAKFAALAAALFDGDGKPAGGWVAQPADLERPFTLGAMTAPPGAYRLRVAAIDTSGRSGAVDYAVDVALARTGTLKISGILLGLARGGTFVPRLQFTTEPVVIGYVEMSGAAAGAKVTATLELADTANGPARLAVPLTIEAGAAGRYVAKAALAIGALPPGDYIVRAVVGLDGHPPTRVIGTLRKATPVP